MLQATYACGEVAALKAGLGSSVSPPDTQQRLGPVVAAVQFGHARQCTPNSLRLLAGVQDGWRAIGRRVANDKRAGPGRKGQRRRRGE